MLMKITRLSILVFAVFCPTIVWGHGVVPIPCVEGKVKDVELKDGILQFTLSGSMYFLIRSQCSAQGSAACGSDKDFHLVIRADNVKVRARRWTTSLSPDEEKAYGLPKSPTQEQLTKFYASLAAKSSNVCFAHHGYPKSLAYSEKGFIELIELDEISLISATSDGKSVCELTVPILEGNLNEALEGALMRAQYKALEAMRGYLKSIDAVNKRGEAHDNGRELTR